MSVTAGIIDYGVGNLYSLINAIDVLGAKPVIINSPINKEFDRLILPGVGAFGKAMSELKNKNLINWINQKVLVEKIPVLGICLGMQLMCKESSVGDQKGQNPIHGLGWFDSNVRQFTIENNKKKYKIPDMGWNHLIIKQKNTW
ncbi:MAG: imidazole glycerol phosphate synthase subunit HisH, partial [Nitrospirae bacterium]|nr:imidazole glycerol phosphate synthase subunit HisH [Nitrospirota bacterium]